MKKDVFIKFRGGKYLVVPYKEATKRRRNLGNELRSKGFKIIRSYKDAMANGARYTIGVGREPLGERCWEDMKKYKSQVEKIIKKYFSSAQHEGKTGGWIETFTWSIKHSVK